MKERIYIMIRNREEGGKYSFQGFVVKDNLSEGDVPTKEEILRNIDGYFASAGYSPSRHGVNVEVKRDLYNGDGAWQRTEILLEVFSRRDGIKWIEENKKIVKEMGGWTEGWKCK